MAGRVLCPNLAHPYPPPTPLTLCLEPGQGLVVVGEMRMGSRKEAEILGTFC